MDKKEWVKPYDFSNDYKKLPVKKRVGLIKIAKILLNQQKENTAILSDTIPPKENERQGLT